MAIGGDIIPVEDWKRGLEIAMQHIVTSSGTPHADGTTFDNKICFKRNPTAPTTDASDDFPNALGDICLHYIADVLTGIYMAVSGNLTSTCKWVRLDA
jgi:hypothetical protein